MRQIRFNVASTLRISSNAIAAKKPIPTAVIWLALPAKELMCSLITSVEVGTKLVNKKLSISMRVDSKPGKAENIATPTAINGTNDRSVT